MSIYSKHNKLLKLVQKRQTNCWEGYTNIGDYHDGAYECDFISPYTKGAGNVDSDIMLVLQDWSSEDDMNLPMNPEKARLGRTPNYPTNKNLSRLLNQFFQRDLEDIYATNLFPFIKPGSISAKIYQQDLLRAAIEYAIPQIRIVKPKLVISFGKRTSIALKRATVNKPLKALKDEINKPYEFEGIWISPQAHPGGRGISNQGGLAQIEKQWEILARFYKTL